MILRQLADRQLQTPPPDAFAIAVARHQLPGSNDPRIGELHLARAVDIHHFVDELGLSHVRWGETDAARPREIVEVIVPIASALVSAAASILAAWISRPKLAKSKNGDNLQFDTPTAGIKIKRADGAELCIDYRMELKPAQQQAVIHAFMTGVDATS